MNLKKLLRSLRWTMAYWLNVNKFHSLGKDCRFHRNIIWHRRKNISIGNGVIIKEGCRLEALRTRSNKKALRLRIGNNTSFQERCQISAADKIVIGNDVLVGANVLITDHDHRYDHDTKPPACTKELKTSPVVIEDGVWLGFGCVVLKGVTIGKRAVVGANAVVTRNVEPGCIVAGNPARVIGKIKSKASECDSS